MFRQLLGFFFVILSPFFLNDVEAYQVGNNPFRRAEPLDPEGKYLLEWEVDWKTKRVTFNVTVETRGWVAFGLSNDGQLSSGADMVIGGVDGHGRAYFSDRHRNKGSDVSVLDKQQDWSLNSAWESKTHTFLVFSRAFDTCDEKDYELTLNKVTVHWAYGQHDDADGLHPTNQGIYHTHLLDPDYAPEIVRRGFNTDPSLITANRNEAIPPDTKTWSIHRSLRLESNESSYICSIHRAPRLRKKHHWIGFEVTFPNEQSRLASHHLFLYRCNHPRGYKGRNLFEPHLNNPGEACYLWRNPSTDLRFPINFCTAMQLEWAIGMRAFFMPNHVGIPFGESPDEYYLLQTHYDNPFKLSGFQVDLRLDNFYTSHLRPHDGGMIQFSHDVPSLPESMLIPPQSPDHRIFAHCSPECTRKMFPPSGITIAAMTLHQHNTGMGLRVRHFRGGRELPWISYDDNFDNLVQPFRHLRKEVKVMPGDQVSLDCHYSTNGSTAVGGFSTRQEMCGVIAVYYNRMEEYSHCESGIISPEAREKFLGIGNASWVEGELEWVVKSPRSLQGLKLSQVSDRFVNWTTERKAEFQRFHEVAQYTGRCSKELFTRSLGEIAELEESQPPLGVPLRGPVDTPTDYVGPVSYPLGAIVYLPPQSPCKSKIG